MYQFKTINIVPTKPLTQIIYMRHLKTRKEVLCWISFRLITRVLFVFSPPICGSWIFFNWLFNIGLGYLGFAWNGRRKELFGNHFCWLWWIFLKTRYFLLHDLFRLFHDLFLMGLAIIKEKPRTNPRKQLIKLIVLCHRLVTDKELRCAKHYLLLRYIKLIIHSQILFYI